MVSAKWPKTNCVGSIRADDGGKLCRRLLSAERKDARGRSRWRRQNRHGINNEEMLCSSCKKKTWRSWGWTITRISSNRENGLLKRGKSKHEIEENRERESRLAPKGDAINICCCRIPREKENIHDGGRKKRSWWRKDWLATVWLKDKGTPFGSCGWVRSRNWATKRTHFGSFSSSSCLWPCIYFLLCNTLVLVVDHTCKLARREKCAAANESGKLKVDILTIVSAENEEIAKR